MNPITYHVTSSGLVWRDGVGKVELVGSFQSLDLAVEAAKRMARQSAHAGILVLGAGCTAPRYIRPEPVERRT